MPLIGGHLKPLGALRLRSGARQDLLNMLDVPHAERVLSFGIAHFGGPLEQVPSDKRTLFFFQIADAELVDRLRVVRIRLLRDQRVDLRLEHCFAPLKLVSPLFFEVVLLIRADDERRPDQKKSETSGENGKKAKTVFHGSGPFLCCKKKEKFRQITIYNNTCPRKIQVKRKKSTKQDLQDLYL